MIGDVAIGATHEHICAGCAAQQTATNNAQNMRGGRCMMEDVVGTDSRNTGGAGCVIEDVAMRRCKKHRRWGMQDYDI